MKPQNAQATNMVKPKSDKTTKMVSKGTESAKKAEKPPENPKKSDIPEKKSKPGMVTIQAEQPLSFRHWEDPKKMVRVKQGEQVEVPDALADELCKARKSFYAFGGERFGEEGKVRHTEIKARKISTPA